MPALGLGVYRSAPEDTAGAVRTALGNGYRLIDTAAAYGNEAQVGEGITGSGLDRSEVFVTTKLWNSEHGFDATLRAFDTSLHSLGLDYLDLYLIHWPIPAEFDATIASYQAMEKLLDEGRVRAIGVSNFTEKHLETLISRTTVVPAVNQVELHPFFTQPAVRDADATHGVITQAWSPIGGVYSNHPADPDDLVRPLEHPTLAGLAARYGKSPAQIVLRWHLQQGRAVIPKSVRANRIAENIDVFDFALTSEDIDAIDAIDIVLRGGSDPDLVEAHTFG
ncbi:aldo/keto reductase [Amycolatopsis acidicola]|nr:aldo/keto reductase [Amycolatopsis acidicola]